MTLIRKGIVALSVGVIIPVYASSQNPEITLQDYTSEISVTTLAGLSISQEIGSPTSLPEVTEGNIPALQGLFATLTGVSPSSSSLDLTQYTENDRPEIAYCEKTHTLLVTLPDGSSQCKVAVTDISGQIIVSGAYSTVVKLPTLSPGLYIAMAVTKNNTHKSLKFVVK